MILSTKLSLKFITDKKRRMLKAILRRYRALVNRYIEHVWVHGGRLDKETYGTCQPGGLRCCYRQQALRHALAIVVTTRKAAEVQGVLPSIPRFRGALKIATPDLLRIEEGRGVFDIVIRLSTLKRRIWMAIPTKATAHYRKLEAVPGAKLKPHTANISEDFVAVCFDIPDQSPKPAGAEVGIDLGVIKLITTSEGRFYGTEFRQIRDKIRRRKPGSKGKAQALRHRDNYIGYALNRLPWHLWKMIAHEDLTGIRTGKQPNRGKAFRRAMAPWVHRQVIARLVQKAHLHRVEAVAIDPRNTSRMCPSCGGVSKDNRRGETFECVVCGYKNDADVVGALNIIARTRDTSGSVGTPEP